MWGIDMSGVRVFFRESYIRRQGLCYQIYGFMAAHREEEQTPVIGIKENIA